MAALLGLVLALIALSALDEALWPESYDEQPARRMGHNPPRHGRQVHTPTAASHSPARGWTH